VTGVAGVCLREPPGRAFGEKLLLLGTAATLDQPRGDFVREVAGVSVVVHRKLFERLVPGAALVEFVRELPGPVTPRTGDRRGPPGRLLVAGRGWIVCHDGPYAAAVKKRYVPAGETTRMVENVIWPVYVDAGKTRSEGRRVARELAIEEPTVDEIAKAVQQVGYDAVVERDVAYSREHWRERGRVLVKGAEDATKNDIVQAVAAYVTAMRD